MLAGCLLTSGASKISGSWCKTGGKMTTKSPFRRQQSWLSKWSVKSSWTKRKMPEKEQSRKTSRMVLSERNKQASFLLKYNCSWEVLSFNHQSSLPITSIDREILFQSAARGSWCGLWMGEEGRGETVWGISQAIDNCVALGQKVTN